jgi:hypothetical protein
VQAIDLGYEPYKTKIKEAVELVLNKMAKPRKNARKYQSHLIAVMEPELQQFPKVS